MASITLPYLFGEGLLSPVRAGLNLPRDASSNLARATVRITTNGTATAITRTSARTGGLHRRRPGTSAIQAKSGANHSVRAKVVGRAPKNRPITSTLKMLASPMPK